MIENRVVYDKQSLYAIIHEYSKALLRNSFSYHKNPYQEGVIPPSVEQTVEKVSSLLATAQIELLEKSKIVRHSKSEALLYLQQMDVEPDAIIMSLLDYLYEDKINLEAGNEK